MKKVFLNFILKIMTAFFIACMIFRVATHVNPFSITKEDDFAFTVLILFVAGFILLIMLTTQRRNRYQPKRLKNVSASHQAAQTPVMAKKEVPEKKTEQTNGPVKQRTKEPQIETITDDLKPIVSAVRFSDIAGYQQTKDSVRFLVDCMKNLSNLEWVGAKLPKGVLLSGPPGTGKTYMAKAIAGEANVPFFAVSGSSFMNLYVGQGPRNIRALYKKAAENAPCVIFIDEIDAIGGARSADDNFERRSTLNALLVALDGMAQNSGILTIAATNTPESLDPALVRAGRFDRKIFMPLPDLEERKAILKIHCKNKPLGEDVDFQKLALSTPGFSGSALATLANEAALHAAFCNKLVISMEDFENASFQIIMEGEERRCADQDAQRITAYHEAGHALAIKLLEQEPVPKVTIIGSTSGAGGVTFRADSSKAFMSKLHLEKEIKSVYAGRAAEELLLGKEDITTGAASDIRQATSLIRRYLLTYGMGDVMLNMDDLLKSQMPESMIQEAADLSKRLYQETLDFLQEHRTYLDKIAQALLERETILDSDLDEILKG